MIDDLRRPDGHKNENRDSIRQDSNSAPLSDREVPLNPRRTPAVVQAWLDGEVSMVEAARGEGAKDVEFWNKLNEQAEERRHMRTPVHVQQRIMEAIPKSAPTVESGWFQKDSHLSNGMLMLYGLAIAGLGILAATLLF